MTTTCPKDEDVQGTSSESNQDIIEVARQLKMQSGKVEAALQAIKKAKEIRPESLAKKVSV